MGVGITEGRPFNWALGVGLDLLVVMISLFYIFMCLLFYYFSFFFSLFLFVSFYKFCDKRVDIVAIQDLTEFVAQQRKNAKKPELLQVPKERVYKVKDKNLAKMLELD